MIYCRGLALIYSFSGSAEVKFALAFTRNNQPVAKKMLRQTTGGAAHEPDAFMSSGQTATGKALPEHRQLPPMGAYLFLDVRLNLRSDSSAKEIASFLPLRSSQRCLSMPISNKPRKDEKCPASELFRLFLCILQSRRVDGDVAEWSKALPC